MTTKPRPSSYEVRAEFARFDHLPPGDVGYGPGLQRALKAVKESDRGEATLADLRAIADRYRAMGAVGADRAEVLQALADGEVSAEIQRLVVFMLQDTRDTLDEARWALRQIGMRSDEATVRLVALAIRASDPDLGWMSDALIAGHKAHPHVFTGVLHGLEDEKNTGHDFAEAVDAASTVADFRAIEQFGKVGLAFPGLLGQNAKLGRQGQAAGVVARALSNGVALSDEVMAQLRGALRDHVGTADELEAAWRVGNASERGVVRDVAIALGQEAIATRAVH